MSNETDTMNKLEAIAADVETRARKTAEMEAIQARRLAEMEATYAHIPNDYNRVDMTAENGNLVAYTDNGVMTSAVTPYIRHYVIQMESKKQAIPTHVADAILSHNRPLLEIYYGKDSSDILLDRVKKYATSARLSDEDLGIGGIEIDVKDLAA